MKRKIIWNDIKENKLLSFSTCLFMAVSAFLFSLSGLLFTGLLGSVNTLMETAQTPDFLQMHAGVAEEESLLRFAEENESIEAFQLLRFLNLENGAIVLAGHSLADSTQDNGVSVQSGSFDYLLDLTNHIIEVKEGEVYVPVCYRQEYGLQTGEIMQIGKETLVIAGFLRDSQMNSMMASSKRFLVCEKDYERLKQQGTEEFLIEFLLKEGTDVNAVATEYADAGLPANGPAITKPLIRMMNALSDGLMILVLLLVSVLMLLISMLCIRFTLLTKLEGDYREIGVLKAIGIGRKEIRQIYFGKYALLSAVGAVAGIIAAYVVKHPLSVRVQELYGAREHGLSGFLTAVSCALVVEILQLGAVNRTLKRLERVSVVEAIAGRQPGKKRGGRLFGQYAIVMLVIAAGVFMMVVPQNLQSTISSPRFVTYMGIGDGEIRLDIRQTDDILEKTGQVEEMLAADARVSQYAVLVTSSYRMILPDGSGTNLNVECGDHTVFPVTYDSGGAPTGESELAVSYLCAEELGLSIGDTVILAVNGEEKGYTICGIYSDITNGGKTAKAVIEPEEGSVMWSIFYVSLKEGVSKAAWISECQNCLLVDKAISAKVVDIKEYVTATYGQTMRQVKMAAHVAGVAAGGILFVVILLFVRLIVAKERYSISLRKALGFTNGAIRKIYYAKQFAVMFAGILIGTVTGILPGEVLAGVLLRSLGATDFRFIIDGCVIGIGIPLFVVLATVPAVVLALREIKKIKAYECCRGKE